MMGFNRFGVIAGHALLLMAMLLLPGSNAVAQTIDTGLVAGKTQVDTRIPNAEFTGSDGLIVGDVSGGVPDYWRAFAVGGGEVDLEVMPLPENTLFPGSPAVNAVKFTITQLGADQGFDHEPSQITILADTEYKAKVYLRSANADGSPQSVGIAVPLFSNNGFSGQAPGSFSAQATDTWQAFEGPTFTTDTTLTADIAIRLNNDGGDNAIWIALPSMDGPTLEPTEVDYPPIYTMGRDFSETDRFVSTIVFSWYTPTVGQQTGPWRPFEGRESWTGEVPFWRDQIKDLMDANIDVVYVHLIQVFELQRENFFKAANQLRREGYDIPYFSPFLDPLIIWNGNPIDMNTTAGKDAFARQYRRWFVEYMRQNPDPAAESYLLHIDGKIVLNTWHCNPGFTDNIAGLSREDLESRLIDYHAADYPSFQNGIYQVGSNNGLPPAFVDEVVNQFSNTAYISTNTFNGKRVVTMKAGYWDQNLRVPGIFLPRDGGEPYANAWDMLIADQDGGDGEPPIYHVFVETWNEYDEATGIYEGSIEPPVISETNNSGNTDQWSDSQNPREYIDSTYAGAALFNGKPDLDSAILWHDIPTTVQPGSSTEVKMLVRNEGNTKWSGAAGFTLAQDPQDSFSWSNAVRIDDIANEVTTYGGVFRGRPVLFEFTITAPSEPGTYQLNYRMTRQGVAFGDSEALTVEVAAPAKTLVYAWVSSNSQFESILVVDNFGDTEANLRLTAQRATGAGETVNRTIPANGFLRETAASLFPTLGDGSGYTVTVEADVASINGGWVTNNLNAASGRSPSQGVAVEVPNDTADLGQRVGKMLLFPYLPITDGLTSAPVVVNLGPEPANVTMRFYNAAGQMVAEDDQTLANLTPLRPFAAVANTLVPQDADDVYMIAESDGPLITGVGFVFNDFGEPALGNVTAIESSQAKVFSTSLIRKKAERDLVYSWISSNSQFESILVVNNYGMAAANLTLTAQRSTGNGETVNRTIPASGFLRETASSLFPELGEGSGYTVTVHSDVDTVQGGWVTNNLNAASGRSPSQGVAVVNPGDDGSPSDRVGQKLIFPYLPVTDGLTSAPVIVNLGDEATNVTMRFYNQQGQLLATDTATLQNLTPLRPFAAVANVLIPEGSGDVYMIAESDGALITGVGFVFNSFSEPALGNVSTIP